MCIIHWSSTSFAKMTFWYFREDRKITYQPNITTYQHRKHICIINIENNISRNFYFIGKCRLVNVANFCFSNESHISLSSLTKILIYRWIETKMRILNVWILILVTNKKFSYFSLTDFDCNFPSICFEPYCAFLTWPDIGTTVNRSHFLMLYQWEFSFNSFVNIINCNSIFVTCWRSKVHHFLFLTYFFLGIQLRQLYLPT